MKIKTIQIKKLFGMFSHKINLQQKERITIIHGPNGVGKTTVLQMISDIFGSRFNKVAKLDFEKIIITFQMQGSLTITRVIENKKSPELEFRYKFRDIDKTYTYKRSGKGNRPSHTRRYSPYTYIDEYIPELTRVAPRTWYHRSRKENLSLEDVYSRYSHVLPFEFFESTEPQVWLRDLLSQLSVHFIETQRLLVLSDSDDYADSARSRIKHKTAVEMYSQRMSEEINNVLQTSASISASLDRKFPLKVIQLTQASNISNDQIRQLYENQTDYRERLMLCGLLDTEEQMDLPRETLDVEKLNILALYFDDATKKLSVFDSILSKIELFKDIINARFLYKSFNVDKEEGFTFFNDKNGLRIPLNTLSSGEQHELVLSYQLIFEVKEETLILVDEPELSLHVTWQRKFLKDISRISELANLDFLVATHSPAIIHDRRDLVTTLSD